MKTLKFIVPLLFLGFILISATVQEKIIGRWNMVKMVDGDRTKIVEEDEATPYLNFKEDGTVEFGEGDRSPKPGEWSYDPENKKLYVSDKPDKQDEVIIKKLSKKKMVLFIVKQEATLYLVRAN